MCIYDVDACLSYGDFNKGTSKYFSSLHSTQTRGRGNGHFYPVEILQICDLMTYDLLMSAKVLEF